MTTFEIEDMTCGRCIGVITEAVNGVDAAASVRTDLAAHRVDIESTADRAKLSAAITAAGYTPVSLPQPSSPPSTAQPKRGGCCCG